MDKRKRRNYNRPEVVENYYNFYISVKEAQINCGSRITEDIADELVRLARNGKLNGHRC